MRHGNSHRRLGMKSSHRRAVLRNMTTSLLLHERINTTLGRAKELRRLVDQMITLGKRGDLHARRQAASFLFNDEATAKVFDSLAKRFKDRPGGFTRILKTAPRRGDAAEVATIELVDYTFGGAAAAETEKKKEKKEKKEKTAKAAAE